MNLDKLFEDVMPEKYAETLKIINLQNFVNYETALKLKKLGFNNSCIAYYNKKELFSFHQICNEPLKAYYIKMSNRLCCPLKSQVFEWFREKYKLHSTITSISQESWQYHITKPQESLGKLYEEDFYTYQEAETACIEKLITLIT
jgi:hypothetical protein